MGRLQVGINDLATLHPELVKEWNYELNDGLLPTQFTCGSHRKVWWKCSKCGYDWQAKISNRTYLGHGCPECASIWGTSFSEQAIYYYLHKCFGNEVKNRFKLRDEKGFLEADIYLPKYNFVIEYDGQYWHRGNEERDLDKECRFKAMGMKFIRIAEHNRNKVMDNCILYNFVRSFREKHYENLTWAIKELFKMLNLNGNEVNVKKDSGNIMSIYYKNREERSLSSVAPYLLKEWDYEMNGDLLPTQITCGSDLKIWWKCSLEHHWQSTIYDRLNKNYHCPYCSNYRVLKGFNDLATLRPDLLNKWNYKINDKLGIYPDNIICGTAKKVWWKCEKCGHEFPTEVRHMVKYNSCPVCSGKIMKVGYNDYVTRYPEIFKDWDYENNETLPTEIRPKDFRIEFCWKGHICGHEFSDTLRNRLRTKGRCPYCSNRRVLAGFNDLATKFPNVAKKWNYELNGNLLPSEVFYNSSKTFWWKCSQCGHEWQDTVRNRVKHFNCPICKKV